MTEHSKLPPSSAARRVACPGSRALEALYPNTVNLATAREGEIAHDIAARFLREGYTDPQAVDALRAHNNEVTQEMIDGAKLYATTIHKLTLLNPTFHIEERIDISIVHPECWGTPDCWFVENEQLFIFDYKFGHGFVEVLENWQLLEYACGIIDQLDKAAVTVTKIHFYIIQPRSYHRDGPVRTWELHRSQLPGYLHILKEAERAAMEEEAYTFPTDQCFHCRARHACDALQQFNLKTVEFIHGSSTPNELPPAALGAELRELRIAAKLLDARITGMEQEATSLIKRGAAVHGFQLEPGQSRKKWSADTTTILEMAEMMGVDIKKPLEIVTPTQALAAGLPEEVVNNLSQVQSGALKLVETNLKSFKKALAR